MKKLYFLIILSTSILHSFVQLFPTRIILKGTVVTPSTIIQGGYVVIEQKKIAGVYSAITKEQINTNTTYVDTRGIIFPGLIDLHNHVPYNVFPPWLHGRKKFNNRYEWRFNSSTHQKMVKTPSDSMSGYFCERNAFGELRALIGGTTSILDTWSDSCISSLIRNLDDSVQTDGRRIQYSIDIRNHNADKPDEFESELQTFEEELAAGTLDAFIIHLAEGKSSDAVSADEFCLLEENGLLTGKTAIIHGIALGEEQFHKMQAAGTSLIWSPRSNIDLYGETSNVVTAKNNGVRIALAPDWAISGSRNSLEELQYAAAWNKNHLNNFFTDKQLVEMVTIVPAAIAGLNDKIGSIAQGHYADLLVIAGDPEQPYRSLIRAGTFDVKLVFIDGQATYGSQKLMKKFWTTDQLELIHSSPNMVFKRPLLIKEGVEKTFYTVIQSLAQKMVDEGTMLAPLFTGEFFPVIKEKPGISIKTKPPRLFQHRTNPLSNNNMLTSQSNFESRYLYAANRITKAGS